MTRWFDDGETDREYIEKLCGFVRELKQREDYHEIHVKMLIGHILYEIGEVIRSNLLDS